ncbi:ferrochelatase [Kordiimonas aquimaris]|uniref:ferrochelatase n=1 Tax=Kordiimonas aquimaris TaxID=707591 RepID=UPI0021D3B041|nr:ferrochelatase [Kordiimonas aquimaris]
MDIEHLPTDHPKVKFGKTGLLLISLGTPEAPTYWSVRKYLAEFLSDPRVIETPRALWLPVLYGPILTFRPLRSAKAYAKIWDNEKDESPLRTYARSQAEKLQTSFGDTLEVAWAFRYGDPSIMNALEELKAKGCERIIPFALYPQYSATTTASSYDKVFECLGKMRWQPGVHTINRYNDHPKYIKALARSAHESLNTIDWQPEKILMSYHSIPQSYYDKGDPYPCYCKKTSRQFEEATNFDAGTVVTSFQSRVGPAEWVSPYTDKTVSELAASGVKRLAVMAPAFSVDCLETLEELNMELREQFLSEGGTHFHYIPCLNDTEIGIEVLEHVIRDEVSGWLTK